MRDWSWQSIAAVLALAGVIVITKSNLLPIPANAWIWLGLLIAVTSLGIWGACRAGAASRIVAALCLIISLWIWLWVLVAVMWAVGPSYSDGM